MKLVQEYPRDAEDCLRLAATADKPEQHEAIWQIAETWKQLAGIAVRIWKRSSALAGAFAF